MEKRARYKLIACNVFQRDFSAALSRASAIVDAEFLELGLHAESAKLNAVLAERVKAAASARDLAGEAYDAILLGYGLCGNGLVGLEAPGIPVVLPRAHDCCTILLGSRAEFLARFGDRLSASWSSAGYLERGSGYFKASELGKSTGLGMEYAELVERYGEENAAYVWETLHPETPETELRFIETPDTASLGYAEEMRKRAHEEGKDYILLRGSSRLIDGLLAGGWDEADYLVLRPGERVEAAYDHDRVLTAVPAST